MAQLSNTEASNTKISVRDKVTTTQTETAGILPTPPGRAGKIAPPVTDSAATGADSSSDSF